MLGPQLLEVAAQSMLPCSIKWGGCLIRDTVVGAKVLYHFGWRKRIVNRTELHLVIISVYVLPSLLEQVIGVGCFQILTTLTVQRPHHASFYRRTSHE